MLQFLILLIPAAFLAYANGANDNFKGVATLFGSGVSNYKTAIGWATITTLAGSMASIFIAQGLIDQFSGKGLVSDALAGSPEFLLAVAAGAGMTVMLATVIGFPISTTHGLIGALVGSGLMAAGAEVDFGRLGTAFALPLLASPLLAVALSAPLYVLFRYLRISLGVKKEWCVCIGSCETVIPVAGPESVFAMSVRPTIEVNTGETEQCIQRYSGRLWGMQAQKTLDVGHFLSAGFVCFTRSLNDTPKIVALLMAGRALGVNSSMAIVAVCMACGGLLNSRRVAETMSKKITPLNHGQGFTANIVTALLAGFASYLHVPISTTHISVGALFGIGTVTRQANVKVISEILLSWVLTLPIAAFLSAGCFWMFSKFYVM